MSSFSHFDISLDETLLNASMKNSLSTAINKWLTSLVLVREIFY
jgi:hypothetical protein